MDALLAFAAALVAFRLAGLLAGRWRTRRRPELALWSTALLAFAVASAALAWGAAGGWNSPTFRIYYLFGGLLSAALLGAGSLALRGLRLATPLAVAYTGLAVGIVLAVPLEGDLGGTAIPEAQDHLAFFPARLVAVLGNSLGTLAVVVVAAVTIRRRPLGNGLILAGVAVAALGSALFGLGIAGTAATLALAAVLLYAGFVVPAASRPIPDPTPQAEDPDHGRNLEQQARGSAVGEH